MGKKPLCYLGLHKWHSVPNPDGEKYLVCANCGKEETARVRVGPGAGGL
jgi:hypothetical protein